MVAELLRRIHVQGASAADRASSARSACSPLGIMNLDAAYILIPQSWQAIRSSQMDRVGR